MWIASAFFTQPSTSPDRYYEWWIVCTLLGIRFILRCIVHSVAVTFCKEGVYLQSYGFIHWGNIEQISLREYKHKGKGRSTLFKERSIKITIKNHDLIQPNTRIQKLKTMFLVNNHITIKTVRMDIEQVASCLQYIKNNKKNIRNNDTERTVLNMTEYSKIDNMLYRTKKIILKQCPAKRQFANEAQP